MSYSLYLWRFVDGEPAPMDETAIRDVLGPVTVGGMPATGFPEFWDLEAEDGGGLSPVEAPRDTPHPPPRSNSVNNGL